MNSTGALDAVSALRNHDVLSVIIGPTAAGKSALAMQLAREFGLSIISADSRQVYRGFDIGTAKPTMSEREEVPHYCVDVVEPTERYTAHQWARGASAAIDDAIARGRPPVIVGGTGFYVRALVRPLAVVPELDVGRRSLLAGFLETLDFEELGRWCAVLDPARAHLGRTQRLRAIETVLLSGRRISDAFGAPVDVASVRYLVVDPGPAVLRTRIAQRVDAMISAGWLNEVRALIDTVPADAPAWKATGYGALRLFVLGEWSYDDAVERVVIETRQYAKRQRTWCRHQLTEGPVTWVDPTSEGALEKVRDWWAGGD